MKTFYFITLYLLLKTLPVLAQNEPNADLIISGKLEEASKQPVLFANVGLYSSLDSMLIDGAVSDEKGIFTITAVPGNYFLKISYLGLNEKIVPNVVVQDQALSLGVISLKADAQQLQELIVTGQKSQMELHLDKRVFNVGKDLSNLGSNAGYLMASNQFGKFFMQAGLRGEYPDILTELKKTNERNHRKYFNLFPSLHFSYKLEDTQTLQLSYSYRLSRPGFRDLLPFSNFSDSRVFRSGNPLLNPEYTHSFEAGHLLNMPKGTLLSSVYYRHRLGVVENITSVDSSGFTTIRPINLSTGDSYGFEFHLTYDPAEWWKWTANANIFRAVNEGVFQDQRLKSDTYSWTSRISSRVTLARLI